MNDIAKLLRGNEYPGRGIILGCEGDGERAVLAYFIMGRSANSRNRIFKKSGGDVTIYPFDPSKVEDPSLIIYSPVRAHGGTTVVTNGDQTDTVMNAIEKGGSFRRALMDRRFEPDAPNFTPRISGIIKAGGAGFSYALSILKAGDAEGRTCERQFFYYEPRAGAGHFIHTYSGNGSPLPSFSGEPTPVFIKGGIDEFTNEIWSALDAENKISLYTRFINAASGEYEERLINKFSGEDAK